MYAIVPQKYFGGTTQEKKRACHKCPQLLRFAFRYRA
jgi:hypothetical protein